MNRAVRLLNLPPLRNREADVERVQPKRLVLTPVPWGKRDTETAKVVCQHIVEANPATVIPFHPMKDATLRKILRSYRIHH